MRFLDAEPTTDEDGRIYECAICHTHTGYPYHHLQDNHPEKLILGVADFKLIRGRLHNSRPPRYKVDGEEELPFPA